MSPARAKQSQLVGEPSFSKGQVNRAGRLLLDVTEAVARPGSDQVLEKYDAEEVVGAAGAVRWWRIGVGLKFGAGVAEIHAYYVAVSDAFAFLDRGETVPDELRAALYERYAKIRETLSREKQATP